MAHNPPRPKTPEAPPLVIMTPNELRELVREACVEALTEFQAAEAPRPEYATTAEACRAIGCSRAKLHRLRLQGLPTVIVGDSPRFKLYGAGGVLEWIEQHSRAREQGGDRG